MQTILDFRGRTTVGPTNACGLIQIDERAATRTGQTELAPVAASATHHWPQCYSAVLAGGGIRGGQVVGASDATGAQPASRPITPADIHATIFHLLGYNAAHITYPTTDGRPTLLSEGEVIGEVV